MKSLFPTTGNYREDRAAAIAWAREVLADPTATLLDTETTSLHDAEIVQLGVLSLATGVPLIDTLVKPNCPIPAEATAIHGITDAMVAGAPEMLDLLPELVGALHGRRVVVYNAAYDYEVVWGCLLRRWESRPLADAWMAASDWQCAMLPYAAFSGEWNNYRRSYRWQRLPSGDHSAIGDCKAARDIILRMAAG